MGGANYINQLITKSKKHNCCNNNNTIIVGDFNTPLTEMDRSSKQKINKEVKLLDDTLDQMDITDKFRTFHPKTTEYTFFCTWNTLQNRSHPRTQIRSQLVPKDWDLSLHIFRPQGHETRTQSQEESRKELIYMEAKEHPTEE